MAFNETEERAFDDASRAFYKTLGLTDEEYERERAAADAAGPPPRPLTPEETAATIAMLNEELAKIDFGEEEEGDKGETDEQKEPPPSE